MPAKIITTSPNIASLDSLINFSLCSGNITVDITPSVFIGSNAIDIPGASVKITNPAGIVITNYPTSGYNISNDSPPLSSAFTYPIPTIAGNFQYGTYIVDVRLTDANGTQYVVSKSVKICEPDALHKTRNYGSLSAKLSGICKDGKVYVEVDTPPNYNGAQFESVINNFNLLYPTASQLDPINTTLSSFSVQLYEGEYKVTGTICAKYNIGDNIYNEVNYKVKRLKDIKCVIDECCVLGKLVELNNALKAKCTVAESDEISAKIFDTLRLLKTAQLAAECGEDASDYISDLEEVLGCQCTCNCLEGTPLINNIPSKDFIINGCNVSKVTVGLTDTYTIDNYEYIITTNDNGGALTVSSPTLNNCTKSFNLSLNIAAVYSQILSTATSNFNDWSTVINKSWDALETSCLGVTNLVWQSMTFLQRGQALSDAACAGGKCVAIISTPATTVNASDVTVSWVNVSGVYENSIYIDNILSGTVLAGVATYKAVGLADGLAHSYKVVSKCSNGSIGNILSGAFTYYGCPVIAPPTVSSANVIGAVCPYNISALTGALPSGISSEWHTLNNTNNSSLVPNSASVGDGTYYVFAKNTDGCYSLGVKVTLTCTAASSCTEPQNLLVESITGGFRVRFNSAAYPPASYTVKRRISSTPDVDGSYTTIGTPTYNSTVNKWEILDNAAINNTLYVYKAISNCISSSPFILFSFANITCPTLTLTPSNTTVGYSFIPVGGNVDKYEVEIWNSAETTRISFDTHTPAFSNPTVGTFVYLTQGVSYKVRIKAYIGTYVTTCNFQTVTSDYTFRVTQGVTSTATISSVTPSNYNITFGGFPVTNSQAAYGVLNSFGATTYTVALAGTPINATLELRVNGIVIQSITGINTNGNKVFAPVTLFASDSILIILTGN